VSLHPFYELCTLLDTSLVLCELPLTNHPSSTPLPPITRLERDSQTRRCARLRRSLLSALGLGISPHIRACISLRHLTQEIDLEKYYDIYDIRREDVQNIEAEIDNEEFDDMESLKALKALVHRLHTVRRIFLCCLLALEADGCHPDYNKWRVTVEQLRTLGTLIGELGSGIKRILGEEERMHCPGLCGNRAVELICYRILCTPNPQITDVSRE